MFPTILPRRALFLTLTRIDSCFLRSSWLAFHANPLSKQWKTPTSGYAQGCDTRVSGDALGVEASSEQGRRGAECTP